MIHELKVWPQFFGALESGDKTFEVRKDDRPYKGGDVLRLRCWNGSEGYTGFEVFAKVTYIFRGIDCPQFGVQPGYAVLGIKLLTKKERSALLDTSHD